MGNRRRKGDIWIRRWLVEDGDGDEEAEGEVVLEEGRSASALPPMQEGWELRVRDSENGGMIKKTKRSV